MQNRRNIVITLAACGLLASGLVLHAEPLTGDMLPGRASQSTGGNSASDILREAGDNGETAAAAAKNGADAIIYKLEFRDALMVDVIRALSDMSELNIVATEEAAKKRVTVFLQKISVKDALDTISKNAGLWYRQEKNARTFRIMTTQEYQKDMVIYREDTTRIFNLLHPNPVIVATAISDIFGDRVSLSLGVEDDTLSGLGGIGGGTGGAGIGSGSRNGTGLIGSTNARNSTFRSRNSRSSYSSSYGGSRGGSRAIGADRESERVLSEELTPDQLQRLEQIMAAGASGTLSGEALAELSSREQPIYITVNREHNLIIARSSDTAAMKDIEHLIVEMDRPIPQVLLEMKVLELSLGDSYKQVFDLDLLTGRQTSGPDSTQARNPLNSGSTVGSRNTLGLGNFALESSTFVYQFLNNRIRARIQLLEENNRVNTLSSPIVMASNNRPARVFVGEERVLVTGINATGATVANGVVTPGTFEPVTEIRDIGNTLIILPKINADGTVTLNIQQDASTVITGGTTIPVPANGTVQSVPIDTVKTSNLTGTVVAKDGLTVAVGGLISSTTSRNVQKVPLLGDIPMLGQLFQRKIDVNDRSELVLLITPRIISNPAMGAQVSGELVRPLSEQSW